MGQRSSDRQGLSDWKHPPHRGAGIKLLAVVMARVAWWVDHVRDSETSTGSLASSRNLHVLCYA